MRKYILLFIGLIGLSSCYKENMIAADLKGKWQIVSIDGPSNVITPDSLDQYMEFLDCKKAYTANCQVIYTIGLQVDTFRYTLKSNELDVITTASTVANFQNLWKSKRFFISTLNDTDLELYRYDDTLTIHAVKL